MNKNKEISERILQMIDFLKVSKYEFSKKLNYSRPQSVYNIIDGRSNPSYDFFLKLKESEYGELFNIDWLITGNGEMVNLVDYKTIEQDRIVNEPGRPYTDSDGNIIKKLKSELIGVSSDEFTEAEYLPVSAQAGYLSALLEDNGVYEMEKMLVPKVFEKGNYLVVDVTGDSMDDGSTRAICNGDKLLVKEIVIDNGWNKKLPIRQHIFVIVSSEGIVCKQIKEHDTENGVLVCHSFNPMHEDYKIDLKNVFRIFKVKKIVERRISF